MGVIDLDKRVRKLEQDGSGGAVVDQLEAAVTAIENQLTVTSTFITADCETPPEGVSIEYALLDTYGKLCIMTVLLGAGAGSTAADSFVVYKIPDEIRGTFNYMSNSVNCVLDGEDSDQVIAVVPPAAGEYVTYSVIWLVGDPAPTPGE
jgi:hypothetical protein